MPTTSLPRPESASVSESLAQEQAQEQSDHNAHEETG